MGSNTAASDSAGWNEEKQSMNPDEKPTDDPVEMNNEWTAVTKWKEEWSSQLWTQFK